MGNRIGRVCLCSAGGGDISRRHDYNALGNSIYYIRPPEPFSDDDVIHVTTFRSVSGASVSANSSTPPSTASSTVVLESSASFESSMSFMSTPRQQQALRGDGSSAGSCKPVWWSPVGLNESFSPSGYGFENKQNKQSLKRILNRVVFGSIVKRVLSIKKKSENANANDRVSFNDAKLGYSLSLCNGEDDVDNDDENYYDYDYLDDGDGNGCKVLNCKCSHNYGDLKNSRHCCRGRENLDIVATNAVTVRNLMGSENLQWAQGRAGEDRVHIVISEEHEWVFVGIYDGFNGPDATDYLLDNLFYAVHDELKGLLCDHKSEESLELEGKMLGLIKGNDGFCRLGNGYVNGCCSSVLDREAYPLAKEKTNIDSVSKGVGGKNSRNGYVHMGWENEGDSKILGHDKRVQLQLSVTGASVFSHSDVLLALSEALRKTEDAFLKTVDEVISNNPVLAMMGSCVLVMLMKGEDVYLMNVGDSRAVLATQRANSLQLTMEHSTLVKEEVHRIRKEHPDDPFAITKGRVKGYLNVTRAFGAGFLKQPRQNNAVLETFKVNYIGDSPYITCSPSLYHHRLSSSDRFLILSSDGLHQYFTNEEAVAKVDSFISASPERDPAQLLIKEALCRAAKRAGMDFHDLLDIPQGERRLYHDDISIVIISFKGKIWRSSV